MAEWFKGRRVDDCELCEGEFGETTGEVGDLLACSECVFEDRVERGNES
jgi:hypothetical protein